MTIDYKIGLTKVGMVTLASLGIHDPQGVPVQYAEHVPALDGSQFGSGFLQCEWSWSFISVAHVNALRAFCPEPAIHASLWIKTLKSGGGTAVYSAVMWWPQTEPAFRDDKYQDFVLKFVKLVAESST